MLGSRGRDLLLPIIVGLVLTTGLLVQSSATSPDEGKAVDSVRTALLAVDFSKVIGSCKFVPVHKDAVDDGTPDGSWVALMSKKIGAEIPDRDLTPLEAGRLGVWMLPGKGQTTVHHTMSVIAAYYQQYSRFPESGRCACSASHARRARKVPEHEHGRAGPALLSGHQPDHWQVLRYISGISVGARSNIDPDYRRSCRGAEGLRKLPYARKPCQLSYG